jgi:hypothetical protein
MAYKNNNVKLTSHQLETRKRFKEAAEYAKAVFNDPEKRKAYEQNLNGCSSVYAAAMKDFLRSPKQDVNL